MPVVTVRAMTTAKALGLPLALLVAFALFVGGYALFAQLTDPPSPFSWITTAVGAAAAVAITQIKSFVRALFVLMALYIGVEWVATDLGAAQFWYGVGVIVAAICLDAVLSIGRGFVRAGRRSRELAALAEECPPAEVSADLFAVAAATAEEPERAPEPMIVGLCGYAGAGKDTAAKGLLWTGDWHHASFAAKLKDFVYAVNPYVPVRKGQIGYDDFNVADEPVVWVRYAELLDKVGHEVAKYGNDEVRELQQRTGTDAGRDVLGDDVWVDAVFRDLLPGNVVFTDCRFPNEAAAIQDAGGYVVRVVRDGYGPVNGHPSETALDDFPFDAVIHNDGTQQDLHQQLKKALAWLEHTHEDGHHVASCC